MKVWPIDPLVAGYFSLEVSEKLPQGSTECNLNNKVFLQDLVTIKKNVEVPGILFLFIFFKKFVKGESPRISSHSRVFLPF